MYQPGGDTAADKIESNHRNEQENERKLIADVQALESKLGLASCWKVGSEEWEAAKKLIRERDYRKSLDRLEGLLVARIFEMSRLNVAGTGRSHWNSLTVAHSSCIGYKMRKHLGNALRSRSKAIQMAIEAYNTAASSLSPPRQRISWDEILEFSFLSESISCGMHGRMFDRKNGPHRRINC